MATLVINTSDEAMEVPVKLADGTVTSVFIQPRSRAKLPEGAQVIKQFVELNARSVQTRNI